MPLATALAEKHDVAVATARRAVALAKEWRVIVPDASGRPRIAALASAADPADPAPVPVPVPVVPVGEYWSVVVTGPGGIRFAPRMVKGPIDEPDTFRSHLVGIVRAEIVELVHLPETSWISNYELRERRPGSDEAKAIFRLG